MADNETIQYFNDMLAQLEALLYHEVALSAVKKVDFVGTDYLNTKEIQGDTAEEIVESGIKELTSQGIVKEIRYSLHCFGILLKLEMKGCIHIPKEAKLKKEGVKPYMCPIANMIGDRIIEILDYETTYMADMEIDEHSGNCIVKYAIFEDVDKIGQVSDWTKV